LTKNIFGSKNYGVFFQSQKKIKKITIGKYTVCPPLCFLSFFHISF